MRNVNVDIRITGDSVPPLSDQEALRLATMIAVQVHGDQFDKQGRPYLLHVFAVAMSLGPDVDSVVVGLLHDVVEDSEGKWTVEGITMVFGAGIGNAVGQLTRQEGVFYKNYIQQITLFLAIRAKIADLRHNISRLPDLPDEHLWRLRGRYIPALELLERRYHAYQSECSLCCP